MRNEVEIVGIPENLGENLNYTILVAATKLGVDLEDKDLDWVTRVGKPLLYQKIAAICRGQWSLNFCVDLNGIKSLKLQS
ncbi:unnamed protein product [Parnassius apollo]|uniref:(apollo) hypothetical protein n=1 Tax=Parnassius apollo TaxID=110799 RepID=A0A8S3Y352_PARAO|nr:unnamed protein product [Parnassius apollo]